MSKLFFSSTFVACAIAMFACQALAQAPPQGQPRPTGAHGVGAPAGPPAGAPAGPPNAAAYNNQRTAIPTGPVSSPVAVVDLLHIFEQHPNFQQEKMQMDRLKENTEQQLIQQRDALKQMVARLKEFKPGTPDYSNTESEIAQKEAALQVAVRKANQDFIIQEGKMYYKTYKEVLDEVKWYCSQRNILIVLRYTGKQVNPDSPEEIMKEMNEQVVYYHGGIDITNDVLNQIKSKSLAPRVGAQPQQPGMQRPVPR